MGESLGSLDGSTYDFGICVGSPDPVRAVPFIRLEKLRVSRDRITAHVQVFDEQTTNPYMISQALQFCPHLLDHACVNDGGTRFGAVADHTDIPHLLEHLVIELQAYQEKDPQRTFVGVTRWECREEGRATVEVTYTDDLIALGAFKEAVRLLNEAILPAWGMAE